MSISLRGVHTLTNKLNKLSNVKAKKFSKNGYQSIRETDTREYPNGSYFVEVGLKNDNADWENWKHLYFHHYGYEQFLYGEPLNKMTTMHQFWFTNAVDNMSQDVLKDLKEDLKKEINDALKG